MNEIKEKSFLVVCKSLCKRPNSLCALCVILDEGKTFSILKLSRYFDNMTHCCGLCCKPLEGHEHSV